MGKKKSINLGGGRREWIDFDGLKKKLRDIDKTDAAALLKKHFPDEYHREVEQKIAASHRRRWDAWFSEANQSMKRRATALTLPRTEWDEGDWNGHTRILQKAKHAAKSQCGDLDCNHVTAFSDWIFKLDHDSDKFSMSLGKLGEKRVYNKKKFTPPPSVFGSGWSLLFSDLTGQEVSRAISLLTVNNYPIYGKPDYVFFNEKCETALIVEIKISDKKLLPDCWPNVRAQLWAYGHLDFVVERAKKIILIGEVWDLAVRRRKTYQWDMSNSSFCRENEELFACFQQYASNRPP